MTLKQLLQEINDGGWLISNLYQMNYDNWRANLRKAGMKEAVSEGFTAFAHAGTAFKALLRAWNEAQDIEEKKARAAVKKKPKIERYRGKG